MSTIYDRFMASSEVGGREAWRVELLSGIGGEVLEIGAWTGINLHHYQAVSKLVLNEPDVHMRKKLTARLEREGRRHTEVSCPRSPSSPVPEGLDASLPLQRSWSSR